MEFANPHYLFLLLLLIPLIVWYIFKLRKMQATLKMSSTAAFRGKTPSLKVALRHISFLLRLGAIALVIVVIARPQASNTWQNSKSEGIDIVMALDVSGSMLAQDLKPNRLEAAKKVASEFMADRESDRIGLVIFAGESFTQVPLTTDHGVLLNLLHEIKPGMIEDGTAIGLGLANAVNRLKDSDSKSKVIILLTDGSNNRGQIAPITAAELAKSYGIRVHTIGVGTRGKALAPVINQFGQQKLDYVDVDIDEKTLTQIADITGGHYFRAVDNASLKSIYSEIDKMEKSMISVNNVTRKQELFLPYALFALGLVLVELVLRRTVLRNIP
jgi:Ca-activated chloride channel family protein